jgi:hypothetical protein
MFSLPHTKNNSSRNASNLFQGISIVIVLVLFSWFLIRPWMAKTIESRGKLKSAQKELSSIEADQMELNRLVTELHSSPEDVALVDEALPLNGRISKVYVLLDNLVRTSGMTMAVLSSEDSQSIISAGDKPVLAHPFQPGRKLHTIEIAASITGTMEQLKNLMQLMETNGRVLDVETLQVIGGDPVTKFRMTVKAYAYEKVEEGSSKVKK